MLMEHCPFYDGEHEVDFTLKHHDQIPQRLGMIRPKSMEAAQRYSAGFL